MSVTFMREFERDPAAYIRKLHAEATERMNRQAAETSKAAESERLRKAYADRRTPPEAPDAA